MRNAVENLKQETDNQTNGHTKPEKEVSENNHSENFSVSNQNGQENNEERKKRLYKKYSRILDSLLNLVDQEKEDEVQRIVAKMPQPWRNMAKTRVKVQKLFNAIEQDIQELKEWGKKQGNPWFCLSAQAYKALEINFARKATEKEMKRIKNGKYSGQWIRFKMGLNGKSRWITIVPEEPESSVAKALFYSLHELRIACRETVREYKAQK